MNVFVIQAKNLFWSSNYVWNDCPDVYPNRERADKILLKGGPELFAEHHDIDVKDIEVVEYVLFQKV